MVTPTHLSSLRSSSPGMSMEGETQVAHDQQGGDTRPDPRPPKPVVEVLMVSDITCPWCWVAKRRLEYAMGRLQDKFRFKVHFSPFLLRPNCPREGIPNPDFNKDSIKLYHIREIGSDVALQIDFRCPIVPYSVPALTLRQYVRESNYPNAVQSQLTEKLFEAYFIKGMALSRRDLLQISSELMLNLQKVVPYLDDPANEEDVIAQAQSWRDQGVQAVPFFFMNGKAVCSGAQEVDDFVKTILKVADKYPEEKMQDEAEP